MLKLNSTNPLDTKVQTRDGRPARIICVDRKGDTPLVALVENAGGEAYYSYMLHGSFTTTGALHGFDLVNAPVKHVRWVNFNSGEIAGAYKTKSEADGGSINSRIACVKVEFTEGEGL